MNDYRISYADSDGKQDWVMLTERSEMAARERFNASHKTSGFSVTGVDFVRENVFATQLQEQFENCVGMLSSAERTIHEPRSQNRLMQEAIDRLQRENKRHEQQPLSAVDFREVCRVVEAKAKNLEDEVEDAVLRIVANADQPDSKQFLDAVFDHRIAQKALDRCQEALQKLRPMLRQATSDSGLTKEKHLCL